MAAWAGLAALASCGGERADDAAVASSAVAGEGTSPSADLHWRELGAWTGRGGRQTESFEVASGALRLVWGAEAVGPGGAGASGADGAAGEGHPGTLRVSLHSAISGRPLEVVVDQAGPGSGTVPIAVGPRVAYLLIESEGLAWSLALEEGVARR